MEILLTGASGFIGKNFLELAPGNVKITAIFNSSNDIEKFIKEKKLNNVKLYKCDFTKKQEVETLFKKIGSDFDYCIYLAGNVDVPLSISNPLKDLEINVVALINFLKSCSSIKRFIYMSSAAVYDGNKGAVTTKTNLNPTIPYCISKLMCEQYVKFFFYSGKIKEYVIIRFSGAYGQYSKELKFMSKLVSDITQNKRTIEIYGDGKNLINVMYAKDAVKALLKAVNSKKSNIICNLGQENMKIKEAVERTAKALGKKIEIKYTPKIQEQKYITFIYESDFNSVFDFWPDYSFEQGIVEVAESIRINQK